MIETVASAAVFLFAKIFIPVMKRKVSTVAVGAKTIATAYNAGKGMEMFEKTLSQLEERLMEISPDQIEKYYDENREELLRDSCGFFRYMNEILKSKELSKQDVLLQADIPQRYGYKLLCGEKTTKRRDVILRICYAGKLSLAETQKALMIYGMSPLYARDKRDALIMACFNKRPKSIIEVNEYLLKNKMAPLRSSGVQD